MSRRRGSARRRVATPGRRPATGMKKPGIHKPEPDDIVCAVVPSGLPAQVAAGVDAAGIGEPQDFRRETASATRKEEQPASPGRSGRSRPGNAATAITTRNVCAWMRGSNPAAESSSQHAAGNRNSAAQRLQACVCGCLAALRWALAGLLGPRTVDVLACRIGAGLTGRAGGSGRLPVAKWRSTTGRRW